MQVDLVELLQSHPIVHPSRIASATFETGQIVLTIEGYPWWRDSADFSAEDRITFRFGDVTSGEVDPVGLLDADDDEALEDFEIAETSALGWAQPARFNIYCSAPLPHPLDIFTALEDYLRGSQRRPADFLNCGDELANFLRMTASPGYQLARVPEAIRKLLQAILVTQDVPHTIIETAGNCEGKLFVRLAGSAFFCDTAVAEL
jgi:hypothetical protein